MSSRPVGSFVQCTFNSCIILSIDTHKHRIGEGAGSGLPLFFVTFLEQSHLRRVPVSNFRFVVRIDDTISLRTWPYPLFQKSRLAKYKYYSRSQSEVLHNSL
jgi:hypothetical protein